MLRLTVALNFDSSVNGVSMMTTRWPNGYVLQLICSCTSGPISSVIDTGMLLQGVFMRIIVEETCSGSRSQTVFQE